jgi:hypothetical protein
MTRGELERKLRNLLRKKKWIFVFLGIFAVIVIMTYNTSNIEETKFHSDETKQSAIKEVSLGFAFNSFPNGKFLQGISARMEWIFPTLLGKG